MGQLVFSKPFDYAFHAAGTGKCIKLVNLTSQIRLYV